MVRPNLSVLYTERQIARRWFWSLIALEIFQSILASPLSERADAWTDPIPWLKLLMAAGIGIATLFKALSTEDYREMAPIDPRLIPNEPKEPKP